MQPSYDRLIKSIDLELPLIGFYDAPSPAPFEPLVDLTDFTHACIFNFVSHWEKGETLHISSDSPLCRGSLHWLCGLEGRSREDFVRFLVEGEGLRANADLMNQWLDHTKPYKQTNSHLLAGPLKQEAYEYCKTITFFVNPDQLSALITGAYYFSTPNDPPPVTAPFGAGCMELLPLFEDYDRPQAIIGATDMAMRKHLPPDCLAFTVTRPLFERLCALDEKSFLFKPFWKSLRKSRGLPEE